uniref:Uncharacterized protein n=1 Tax=Cannabis sativa TaxID=3483 RepID=A0A803QTI2_CANSA
MRIWNFLILHMSNVEIWKLKRKSRRRLSNLLVGLRNTPTKRVRFVAFRLFKFKQHNVVCELASKDVKYMFFFFMLSKRYTELKCMVFIFISQ